MVNHEESELKIALMLSIAFLFLVAKIKSSQRRFQELGISRKSVVCILKVDLKLPNLVQVKHKLTA